MITLGMRRYQAESLCVGLDKQQNHLTVSDGVKHTEREKDSDVVFSHISAGKWIREDSD